MYESLLSSRVIMLLVIYNGPGLFASRSGALFLLVEARGAGIYVSLRTTEYQARARVFVLQRIFHAHVLS